MLAKEQTPNSEYVANMTREFKDCEIVKSHIFRDFVDVEFEGNTYKAPIGYDEWQRSRYGDYMQLPPKEKQVSHHSFVGYYKK